ncbi:site-2 protease family protein [Fodinibius halophilus]|uniref:Zinc metalloprotease n=1 Tax=Fodinibius halophilus TaxID=1736908 RepID=A0A6M1TIL4_9BACT|nr:site-2 protease family protein [Fodinibius halophilus]NGP89892.1 CBS domain-containing protein [Fodinibius halophilus]
MKGSLKLGRIAGIKIQVHWTFLLLILWIVVLELTKGNSTEAILWSTFFIMVLFGCVVLHELGHALTAQRFNIPTQQITLLPIGGVASLEKMPEDPKEEFLVAIAGPAVNVVIALILYMVLPMEQFLVEDPEMAEEVLSTINGSNFLFFLFSANVLLVLFNLIPAFPMDGGRIFRALLSLKFSRVQATRMAAKLGQLVAFFFLFIGLFYNPILILIAIFVYFGAQGESVMVQQLAILKDHNVEEAMMTNITTVLPEDRLEEVIDIILTGTERDFIVAQNGEVKGVLYQSALIEAFKSNRSDLRVKDIMDKDVKTIQASDDLTTIYRMIQSKTKSFFPVLEGDELVGAVDRENVNEFMVFHGLGHDRLLGSQSKA